MVLRKPVVGIGRIDGFPEYFQLGIQQVDHMQDKSFRGFGDFRGAEFLFAVMGYDQVPDLQGKIGGIDLWKVWRRAQFAA